MIQLPLQPKVTKKGENASVFEVDNLWPGYGVTVGNSLRRVLLSSLEGAAPVKMKIEGVQHEFSTIPGVSEDVVALMLNIKQLRFRLFGDEPQKATLSVKGEKEVKASDFTFPSQLSLTNKDLHIASLTSKDAKLDIEIEVARGLGYQSREERKVEKVEIGEILLDAFYSPVKRVRFQVENMRVGDRTDFDRLTVEIETDGTITPESAFYQAATTLKDHFSVLAEPFASQEEPVSEAEEKPASGKTKLEEMDLSSRTLNALEKNGIKSAEALAKKKESDLTEMEGLGEKAIAEIKKALKKLGMELKED